MTLLVYIILEEQCIRESAHDAYKNNVHNFRGTMYIRECAHDAYKNNVHNFRGTMYIRECAHDAYKNNKVFSTCTCIISACVTTFLM